jgi:FRG domain
MDFDHSPHLSCNSSSYRLLMPSRAVNSSRPCQTLSDYLDEVNKIRKSWRKRKAKSKGDSGSLWFRGQRSAQWKLRPRIYREEYADAEESEIRLAFEGNGLQLATASVNRTKWEWYFLMQHYGAPTRLLDWTANPLVALYFAIADQGENVDSRDAAVWAFDPWRWNRIHGDGLRGPGLADWKEAQPYLPDLEDACDGVRVHKPWPIAVEPPSIDRRLANQTARFLLFGKKEDLVEAADRTDLASQGKKQSRLLQIVIRRSKLESMRCELDDLGINRRVLFPDLQGLGTHLSWEWKSFRNRRRLY